MVRHDRLEGEMLGSCAWIEGAIGRCETIRQRSRVEAEMIFAHTPAGCFGTGAEVAAAAVCAALRGASFVVGHALAPNGGILM